MEDHPIPQDVTGFQFKLIGNMTIKQFAYLAGGCVAAVLFYYSPLILLIKLIFIPLFAGLGAGLAFLPIEGRPMDLMISNFFKDLFSPTQYIFAQSGGHLPISLINLQPVKPKTENKKDSHQIRLEETRQLQLQQVLTQLSRTAHNKLDDKEDMLLAAIFDPNARPQLLSMLEQKDPTAHVLSEDEAMRLKMMHSPLDAEHELEAEAEAIKQELAQAEQQEKQLEETHKDTPESHTHVNTLEKQLDDIMAQKAQLEQELLKMKEQMEKQKEAPVAQPQAADTPLQASQNVRIVPTDRATGVGLPSIPDVPNILIGIIKDPRGNVLPNILVEIKDKDGNPVRAFKTNGLGHFASATPVASGTYTIIFEDPKGNNQFETVSIEAKGEIMMPIEVISHDAREQLRKELFA